MKSALDRGLVVPANQQRQANQQVAPDQNKRPWEDDAWGFKSPQEQYQAMYEYGRGDLTNYVNGIVQQYEQRIQNLTNQDARQKSILMKAIGASIKNPAIDPQDMLTEAAALATKSPEELIDMVLAARANSPEALEKRTEEMVAKRMAERIQEQEAKQLADVTALATPKPRGLVSQMQKGGLAAREAENRSIIDSLRKDGISLL